MNIGQKLNVLKLFRCPGCLTNVELTSCIQARVDFINPFVPNALFL